jgi:hypothetical protein
MRYQWDKLNTQQVGAYAEYYVKMEFTMYGFQVYTTEVDDRGIDFVCRHGTGPFLTIQVKSVRGLNYVFLPKDKFELNPTLFLSLVIFTQGQAPDLFLIPSEHWRTPDAVFVSRDYENRKSAPEWGVNLAVKNLPELEQFRFEEQVLPLMPEIQ